MIVHVINYAACRCQHPSHPSPSHPFPSHPFPSHPLIVRRHISQDLKEAALSMSLQGLTDSVIRQYTGISECSMVRLCNSYQQPAHPSPVPAGWPRVLSAIQVKVCMQSSNPCLWCYVSTRRQPDLGGALSDCHLLSCAGFLQGVFSQY